MSNERTGDQDTWSGIRCDAQEKGVTPSRDPDGANYPDVPSCESPDQVTYWKGMEAYGPVWPNGPLQFKETSSVEVIILRLGHMTSLRAVDQTGIFMPFFQVQILVKI